MENKTEKMSQTGGDSGHTRIKYSVVTWIGTWNGTWNSERTLVENLVRCWEFPGWSRD